MKRFRIASLMTGILYLSMCFAALSSPNPRLGKSVVYSLAVALVALAVVAAVARRGRHRTTEAGFADSGGPLKPRCSGAQEEMRNSHHPRLARSTRIEMCRFTVWTLMLITFYFAICVAALRGANGPFWSKAVFALSVVVVAAATIIAPGRSRRDRMQWTGFSVFGWAYFFMAFVDLAGIRGQGPEPVTGLMLGFLWALYKDCFYTDFLEIRTFFIVGHSVLALVFGFVGTLVGRALDGVNIGPPTETATKS
jgi:hypothetical protein